MLFFKRDEKKNLKESADAFYTKGQWSSALLAYEKLIEKTAPDVKAMRRIADLRAKLGQTKGAVEAYRKTADMYATSGFLVQAIAIYKITLRLDPSAEDLGKKLASLYAERGIGTASGEETADGGEPLAAAEPGRAAAAGDAPSQPPPALPKIPLFSDLPADAFGKLILRLVAHELAEGEFLFREGAPGDSIFIVTSGSVEVVRQGKTLAELGEGEFFGEGAFFSREPRNADVRAKQGTELLEIRREDIEGLISQYPKVSEALSLFYRQRIVDRLFASSPLTAELEPRIRSSLIDLFETRPVARGEAVIREGNRDRALYFVTRGRFEVTTVAPGGGQPVVLDVIGPGNFFGEVTILTREARTATVTALDDGELLRVDGEDIDPYLERFPGLRGVLERAREEHADAAVARILGIPH